VETVGIVLLLFFLIFVTLATVAIARTTRAVKRGVERRTAQARRVVEDQRLRARRFAQPGDIGALTQLRLDLRSSIDSTYEAMERASLPEAAALLDRLNDHARTLDTELKLLDREPDKARIAAQLPSLTERTHRITHSADALRWAAQDRVHHATGDDLASLTREIDLEATALRHWEPLPPPGKKALPDQ
jgi:uncharacterized protein YlxW (UPF0749 family)